MPRFSVKKPLTIFVTVLAIVVLGIVAYIKMTPDLLPNMDFPYVIIVTADPGASPEAVEAEITRPMEQSMATLDRIKSVTSTSRNSMSLVVLEFEEGVNMDTISVDIQQKIELLRGQWDERVAAPYVLKINPSMLPVEVAAVSYRGKDVYALSDFVTDTLTAKLEGISGVAQVSVSGTVTSQAHVILSQEKLDVLSATLTEAINKQLDDAAQELYDARSQVEAAQRAMANAQQSAIGGAVESALGTMQSSLITLQEQRTQMQNRIRQLQDLSAELTRVDAQLAAAQVQISALELLPEPTEEQQEELISLRQQEEELTARRQTLEAQLNALGTNGEEVQQQIAELQDSLQQLDNTIQSLTQDSTIADLSRRVTSGVISGLDAITQLSSGTVQISQALAQIEQGLATIDTYREQVAEQTDLSSMLSVNTISAILTAQNFSMPAGYIQDDDGVSYMVSVGDEFDSREQLEDLLLFDLGIEGVDPIYLHSVADVFVTDNSDEIYAKLNGENGIIVTFTKQSNYATAEVSDNIARRFTQLEGEYEGLDFEPLMDQGDYIYLIVRTILSSLLWGALFSVLVLFIFLRDWRPTLITLLSIPTSVIFAVVLMYFTGVTINMISLSGLAVSVGMLVDNSVVVIENIYRLRAKGATVIQAAVSGAQQVLGAIVASTLTTVCVFLPIVFVEGITKQLFTDLALTMGYSLMASLLVALTLVPAMASGMLRRERAARSGLLDRVYPAYRRALSWSLDHKAVVLLLALVLLVGSAWGALSRGYTFMPEMDMNNLNISVTMPEGCSREEAVELADEVTRRAMTVENVENVGTMMTGAGGSLTMMRQDAGSNDVTLYITLPEGEFGMEAGRKIESLCADLPCQVIASPVMSMEMLTGTGISIKLFGDDMEDLQAAAAALAETMESVPGTAHVSDGLEDAVPALHVSVDRTEAMKKGMTVAQIYLQITAALTDSTTNAGMTLDGTSMDVIIESAEEGRLTRETLLDLRITPDSTSMSGSAMMGSGSMTTGSNSGDLSAFAALAGSTSTESSDSQEDGGDGSFLLGEVATVEETVSLSTIQRDQQRRYLTVTADIAQGYNVTKVTAEVQRAAAELPLPGTVTVSFDGENEAILDAMQQLMLMLLLGVVLVYFIMVAQFQSLKSPFIIMFTIPLAFTGGFLALLIGGIEVSVISLIGFVMLVGIIVNNGIVLVDYINQQRMAGMERREAILDAGVTRMRPILMTSLTTILGLIVMALARNAGTMLMQPVALVCIGGLLYATLMTLFVVPCIYELMNRRDLRRVDEKELETLDI
ncbi:MAG: efflux RND transporter permease subunit [Ruminococcaceae bacterium]|jgi:HAE1 family hydrophobic/amphiphilic exporter-1|nr:efflux RND transporter permease subunit [Oscillospiraceae bacterium]